MLNIVLIGPPGSGKGTQAEKISEKWSIPHISTGELLRNEVAKETPLGLSVAQTLAQGNLVPDDVVLALISERIKAHQSNGFLLDGYPRNIDQALQLNNLLAELNRPITHVLEFIVSDDELLSRIQHRQSLSGRSDDSIEVARDRLAIYARYSQPLLEFYRRESEMKTLFSPKFCRINGVGTLESVFLEIQQTLEGC